MVGVLGAEVGSSGASGGEVAGPAGGLDAGEVAGATGGRTDSIFSSDGAGVVEGASGAAASEASSIPRAVTSAYVPLPSYVVFGGAGAAGPRGPMYKSAFSSGFLSSGFTGPGRSDESSIFFLSSDSAFNGSSFFAS